MKGKILILVVGILLIGVNSFAADGDFFVSGNVGVGTTTPQAKMDVAGKIRAQSPAQGDDAGTVATKGYVDAGLANIPAGQQGPAGPQGPAGATGATGAPGLQGQKGDPGITGPAGPQGDTGPAGPAGPSGMVWQGPWNNTTNYNVNDAVSYQGSLYIAMSVNANADPVNNPSSWSLLALMGSQGPQGIQGVAGPQGPTGATGATGATGLTGPQGIQGVAGPQGPQGATGPQGPQGVPGWGNGMIFNPPSYGGWSWFNQGYCSSSTYTTQSTCVAHSYVWYGGNYSVMGTNRQSVNLNLGQSSGYVFRGVEHSVTAGSVNESMCFNSTAIYSTSVYQGMYIRDSSTGKMTAFTVTPAGVFYVGHYLNANSTPSYLGISGYNLVGPRPTMCMRITDNGTTQSFYYSPDGVAEYLFYTESSSAYVPGGGNLVGYGGMCYGSAGVSYVTCGMTIFHASNTGYSYY